MKKITFLSAVLLSILTLNNANAYQVNLAKINAIKIGVLTERPVVQYEEDKSTFSSCDPVNFHIDWMVDEKTGPISTNVKAYLDDELVLNKTAELAGMDKSYDLFYDYDYTLRNKMISAGEHTFSVELSVSDGSEENTDQMQRTFTVSECNRNVPISGASDKYQVWGGVVGAYPFKDGSLGKVNEVLEKAIVEVNNGEYKTTTDQHGRWYISLPKGANYQLKVTKPGYSKREFILENGDSYYTFAKLSKFSNGQWLPEALGINSERPSSYDISMLYENLTEDNWYSSYLKELIADGYLPGELTCPNCRLRFNAGGKLTREDVILTLLKAKGDNYNDIYWNPEMSEIDVNKVFCDENYTPTNDHLYQSVYMHYKGWVNGELPSGECDLPTLNAHNQITRVEALAFIYRVFNVNTLEGELNISQFSDVNESDWFAPIVSKAYSDGVVSGYPNGTFKPNNIVNFAEFAKFYVGVKELVK